MRSSELYKYYVTIKRRGGGSYKVHRNGCEWLARAGDPVLLGEFIDCQYALKQANEKYKYVEACSICS